VLRPLATICWGIGVVLLILYFGARANGEFERQQAIASFTQIRSSMEATAYPGQVPVLSGAGTYPSPGIPDQSLWSRGRARAYATSTAASPPAALLSIRRIGLEVPVYRDASERNLNRGAGLIPTSAEPGSDGNVVIAAHRDGYFRVLKDVRPGDVVVLEGLSQRREYRITGTFVVKPTDWWPVQDTDAPTITLVTCYPFYFVGSAPLRYIVRGAAAGKERQLVDGDFARAAGS
jgi:sortase A